VKGDRTQRILAAVILQMKCLRMAQGLSHEKLAQRTGLSRAAISHIENGVRKPSLLVCIIIADGLGKNFSHIVRMAEKNEKNL